MEDRHSCLSGLVMKREGQARRLSGQAGVPILHMHCAMTCFSGGQAVLPVPFLMMKSEGLAGVPILYLPPPYNSFRSFSQPPSMARAAFFSISR